AHRRWQVALALRQLIEGLIDFGDDGGDPCRDVIGGDRFGIERRIAGGDSERAVQFSGALADHRDQREKTGVRRRRARAHRRGAGGRRGRGGARGSRGLHRDGGGRNGRRVRGRRRRRSRQGGLGFVRLDRKLLIEEAPQVLDDVVPAAPLVVDVPLQHRERGGASGIV